LAKTPEYLTRLTCGGGTRAHSLARNWRGVMVTQRPLRGRSRRL
jgi:hypothetical protein